MLAVFTLGIQGMKGGSPKHNYMKKLPSAVPLTKDCLSLSERI